MDQKIRVGAVSYLNTKPLIYGLQNGPLTEKIELQLDYPSNLTSLLQKDLLDIALLPVAAIPIIHNAHIVSNYCIASDHKVASVCLFSQVPIDEIQEIFLDYQSKTSIMLLRILLKEYWQIRPSLLEGGADYISQIKDKSAGLIIGDRALEKLEQFPFVYDLAEAWNEYTKLPFVFAAWVANKKINPTFLEEFNIANSIGFQRMDEIISNLAYPHFDLSKYYRNNISYSMDEEKTKGLTLFLKMIERIN
jgi:chorismate dehydratase